MPAPETVSPPHNEVAEAALLASMQWSAHPELAKRYASELDEDDFYRTRHRAVFRAIRELISADDPIDVITVHAQLLATGQLDTAGGMAGLMELWAVTPTAIFHESYARSLRSCRARRDLIATAGDVIRSATEDSDSTDTLIAATESRLQDLQARQTVFRPVISMAEAVDAERDALIAAAQPGAVAGGIKTWIEELDDRIGALEPEKLSIVAARPSMGKSALALQIAKSAAMADHPVLLFPVETGVAEGTRRYIAQGLDMPASKLKECGYGATEAERKRLENARWSLAILPIHWDGTPQIDLSDLRTKSRAWARRHCSKTPGLIVVDYLQLVRVTGFSSDRRHFELGEISRGLKAIARETGCHVMALSQLSRALEKREDKRPTLPDLRESGSLEEDADLVLGIYRDGYYTKQPGDAEILILKNRNGPLGVATVGWEGPRMRFFSLAEQAREFMAEPNYQDREEN